MNKGNQVYLNVKDFKGLINLPNIKEFIILGHIINTLNSSKRFVLRNMENPEAPIKTRDNIYGGLVAASYILETMDRIPSILRKLPKSSLKMFDKEKQWLEKETDPNNLTSFYNQVLKKARSNLTFHFNETINTEILEATINNKYHKYPIKILNGTSDTEYDIVYQLSDEYIINALVDGIEDIDPNIDPTQKLQKRLSIFFKKLSEYTNQLSKFLNKLLLNMAKNIDSR